MRVDVDVVLMIFALVLPSLRCLLSNLQLQMYPNHPANESDAYASKWMAERFVSIRLRQPLHFYCSARRQKPEDATFFPGDLGIFANGSGGQLNLDLDERPSAAKASTEMRLPADKTLALRMDVLKGRYCLRVDTPVLVPSWSYGHDGDVFPQQIVHRCVANFFVAMREKGVADILPPCVMEYRIFPIMEARIPELALLEAIYRKWPSAIETVMLWSGAGYGVVSEMGRAATSTTMWDQTEASLKELRHWTEETALLHY